MKIFKTIRDKYISADSVMAADRKTVEDKLKRNIITAGGTSSVTATATEEVQIPITKVVAQVGNKFTVSNNRVYVGSGISKVLVSGKVYCNLVANRGSVFNFNIRKNGNGINTQINNGYSATAGRNACLSSSPKLEPVNEGDYFDYNVYAYSGDVIRSDNTNMTFLTIEAVE